MSSSHHRLLILAIILIVPLLLLTGVASALDQGAASAPAPALALMPAAAPLPLGSSINSSADWQVMPDSNGYHFGSSVAGAGDVNNDGYDDAIVGSPCYFNDYTCQGRAFLYYGSASGLSPSHNWTVGSTNWTGYTYYGNVVAAAGDVNNDGYDDILVAENYYEQWNGSLDRNGAVYVYHGGPGGPATTASWVAFGDSNWARLGTSAAGAGDINNDGYDDIIVGALRDNGGDAGYEGAIYVFHGSAAGLSASANWSYFGDDPGQELGSVVAGAGDVNNDGYDDVLFSAPWRTGGGTVYAAYGGSGGITGVDWSKTLVGEAYGVGLDGAGDVNGDGYDDIVVGGFIGNAYVFHGSATGLESTAARTLTPPQRLPYDVYPNGAGDVNNDGYDDILVGAQYYSNGQEDEGAIFLHYGSASGVEAEPAWIIESDIIDLRLGGQAIGHQGAGDVNNDGSDDFIAGSPIYKDGPVDRGKAWAFYGSVDVPITSLVATNDGPTPFGAATMLTATVASGSRVAYEWDLDDGNIGSTAVLAHTYGSVGSYTAVVTASNAVSLLTATTTVNVVHLPVSGLVAVNDSPTELGAPTAFTATVSGGTSVAYAWDFGDGASGSGATTSHTYAGPGPFTAVVTATNPLNQQTATTTVYVDVPVAGLSVGSDGPTELGNTTAFTAAVAAGSNVAYQWDYDDGNGGAGPAPTHTYGAVGSYSAVVTASNSLGYETATVLVDVDVPLSGLSASNDSPRGAGEPATFTATLSSGSRPSFVWDFGDDSTGMGAVTDHAYASVGNYTAVVTASNSLGQVTATTPVTIADAPIAGLSAANDGPTSLGGATTLTATVAAGSGISYQWDLGDGETASGAVVSYVYPTYGTFTATVTATNSANTMAASTTVVVTPACLVRLNGVDYATPQAAVDVSSDPNDVVQVAGTCTGVNSLGGFGQHVYIGKSLTLRGGYSADFSRWDPEAYPTTLDPEGLGRVVTINGAGITPRVEGLRLTNGVPVDTWGGAGLFSWYASPVISQCVVFSNTLANDSYGGGIRVLQADNAAIVASRIYSNTATYYGGGIDFTTIGAGLIADNDIHGNDAGYGGGGVHLSNGTAITVTGNVIADNTTPRHGGGIRIYNSNDTMGVLLEGNLVAGNYAAGSYGGGIAAQRIYDYRMENNEIVGNQLANAGQGAGIYLYPYGGAGTLVNNVVADNEFLGAGSGAGIYYYGGNAGAALLHTTLARNQGGAGFYTTGNNTVFLTNTIVASHTVGVHVVGYGSASMNGVMWGDDGWANGTDWIKDFNGTFNLANDYAGMPEFVDPDGGDYHLGLDSWAVDDCVDSGVAADIDGDARPAGFGYDCGADELYYETMELAPGMNNVLPGGDLAFDVPAAYAESVRVFYIPVDEPVATIYGYQFAGMAFVLEAYDMDWNDVTTVTPPFSLTVHYDGDNLPPGADEAALALLRYDENAIAWIPLPVLARDLPGDNLTVQLDHFSDFALAVAPCAPAAAPSLELTLLGADVLLTWDATGSEYEVWASSDPYLDPDNPGGATPTITGDASFLHAGAASGPGASYYVVRARNACGEPSPASNRKGVCTFGLTPGQ